MTSRSKDREEALALVRSTNSGVRFRKEIEAIMNQLEVTYEQQIINETATKVREETIKETMVEVTEGQRAILRRMLQERFGTVPEGVLQRIAAADKAKIDAVLPEVYRVNSPEELPL